MFELRVPGGDVTAQGGAELGPRRERAPSGRGGAVSTSATPCTVGDHHARTGVGRVAAREGLDRRHVRRAASPSIVLSASEAIATASRSTFDGQPLLLVARVDEPERHLEHREDDDGEREVADQQAARHARSRSPTPRTVSISVGSPSFLRSAATCTSTVFDDPYQVVSHTSRRIRWRSTTTPGSEASSASRSNSFSVSCSSRPSIVARRAGTSTSSSPGDEACRDASRPARRAARDGPDPRDELAQPERLDDVVVRAELEPDDAVDLLALRRDHDDRHVRAGPQLAADREAVDIGQPNVEQHEVGRRRVEGFLPGGDTGDLEALRREPLDERLRDRVFVLDDEQVHDLIVGVRARPTAGSVAESWRTPCLRLGRRLPGGPTFERHISNGGLSMNRTRALIVSLAVGVAAIAGVFALGHTLALGNQAHADDGPPGRAAHRAARPLRGVAPQGSGTEAAALPPVPAAGSSSAPDAERSERSAPERAAVRVVYHRPPPIVVIKHRAGGEHESRREGAGADD